MSTSKSVPVTLIGSTGLTGAATLRSLLASPLQPFTIRTFTRKPPAATTTGNPATEHTNRTFSDLTAAANEKLASPGSVYITCLGTTRAAAGGFEAQKKIDLDLNRDLAQKAREDGATSAILVSSGGANANSMMGYPAIKGQLEEDLKGMGYEKTVILQPGLLLGERSESRFAEAMSQKIFWGLGKVGLPMQKLSIEAADVGDCIAYYATHLPEEKVKVVGNGEMIEAARMWREANAGAAK